VDCFLLVDVGPDVLRWSLLETARKINPPSLGSRFREQETWNKENLQLTCYWLRDILGVGYMHMRMMSSHGNSQCHGLAPSPTSAIASQQRLARCAKASTKAASYNGIRRSKLLERCMWCAGACVHQVRPDALRLKLHLVPSAPIGSVAPGPPHHPIKGPRGRKVERVKLYGDVLDTKPRLLPGKLLPAPAN
jgi:hypothetical protein